MDYQTDRKYLWIGKYASEAVFEEMASKGYADAAAQVSQSNLIHALDDLGVSADTLNAYNVPNSYHDKEIVQRTWSRTGRSQDVSIGFKNLGYLAVLDRMRNMKVAARSWASRNAGSRQVVVIVYGMQSSLLSAAAEVKRLIPRSVICLLVPDLPQYMDMSMSLTKRVLKAMDWIVIKRLLRCVDRYVLYTKHMADFLKIPDGQWMVMEGSLDPKEFEGSDLESDSTLTKTTVMYSGRIDKRYGIPELLSAIDRIEGPDYEFWFTGTGNAVELVRSKSEVDSRIRYLGFLGSRQAVLAKQREATMLINMRLPTEEGSAYCFPSKILEYMASGRPVLTFRLSGIPDEYYDYLVTMKSPCAEDIAAAIEYVGRLDEAGRSGIGRAARDYVLRSKNSQTQARRILAFCSGDGPSV